MKKSQEQAVFGPEEVRTYSMSMMKKIFKSDLKNSPFPIDDCWLEPAEKSPQLKRENYDHVFYVAEGEVYIFLQNEWYLATKGSCVLVPAGVEYGYENRSLEKARLLSAELSQADLLH